MGSCFSYIFFRYYPQQKKKTETHEGEQFRFCLGLDTAVHVVLFFGSFAFVGFKSALINLALACWAYSCYLTMREKQAIFYVVLLVLAFAFSIVDLTRDLYGNLQFVSKLVNLVLYGILGVYTCYRYRDFRKSGGLHGTVAMLNEKLLEDYKKQL